MSKTFIGIGVSENPFTGQTTCTNKDSSVVTFSLDTPGTKGTASRGGFFGQGEPFVEISLPNGDVKTMRLTEEWSCTDPDGNQQPLFSKANQ